MELHTPKEFNSAVLAGTFESNTREWYELRKTGIGGSDIGTICGLNPWESAYTLWAKRTEQIPEEQLNSWAVRLGNAFEQPILDLYQEEYPDQIIYRTGTYRHKDYPFMLANPDALAYDPETDTWTLIEVKTARYEWGAIPPHYVAQVQHYLFVMGIDHAVICGISGMVWMEHAIKADKFEQDNQLLMAKRFWDKIQNFEKPDWDGSESTYQTVRKMNTDLDDSEVDIGEMGIHVANAQARFDEAQAELNKAKSATLDAMGPARVAYMDIDGQRHTVATKHMRGNTPVLTVKK